MLFIHPRYVFFNKSFRVCLQTTCFIPKSQAPPSHVLSPDLIFCPHSSCFVPRFYAFFPYLKCCPLSHVPKPSFLSPNLMFCLLILCVVCWSYVFVPRCYLFVPWFCVFVPRSHQQSGSQSLAKQTGVNGVESQTFKICHNASVCRIRLFKLPKHQSGGEVGGQVLICQCWPSTGDE